jgi:hypothetical protein
VPISQGIYQRLLPINTGENSIRMAYDHRFEGVWVFITPLAGPAATTHYFLERKTNAWWPVEFDNPNHNPLCCVTFDGNLPDDRCVLIGSWDGYVRKVDPEATTDDGTPITSSVTIGPFLTKDFDEIVLNQLLADLAEDSGPVTWTVFVGTTAEAALASRGVRSGTWTAGRNHASPVQRGGHAVYVRIDATGPWQLERIRAFVESRGLYRAQQK